MTRMFAHRPAKILMRSTIKYLTLLFKSCLWPISESFSIYGYPFEPSHEISVLIVLSSYGGSAELGSAKLAEM